MKIKKFLNQHRRDFYAVFECEHCGFEHNRSGYDDNNFHRNVIPTFKCPRCEKTATDDYRPLTTKYPDGITV